MKKIRYFCFSPHKYSNEPNQPKKYKNFDFSRCNSCGSPKNFWYQLWYQLGPNYARAVEQLPFFSNKEIIFFSNQYYKLPNFYDFKNFSKYDIIIFCATVNVWNIFFKKCYFLENNYLRNIFGWSIWLKFQICE